MVSKKTISYEDSGVNIDLGNTAVKKISALAKKTFNSKVITDIGGFAALYSLGDAQKHNQPVLVASTDGVGTKLKVAIMADYHENIGQDLVAMCVNDILAQGATPLFFLDYLAINKVDPDKVAKIVQGIATACRYANCPLIGGETAEMPDMYQDGDYDLAGFAVGLVEQSKIIDGKSIKNGDVIIGLSSSGLHSNGFSLVRKIIFDHLKLKIDSKFLDSTVAEVLLTPTKIYTKNVSSLFNKFIIKGIAHITGGGLPENIPRILPKDLKASIQLNTWQEHDIFTFFRENGLVEEKELFRTFNMGIGLILVVDGKQSAEIIQELSKLGEKAQIIGEIKNKNSADDDSFELIKG